MDYAFRPKTEQELIEEAAKFIANTAKKMKPGDTLIIDRYPNEPGKNMFMITVKTGA